LFVIQTIGYFFCLPPANLPFRAIALGFENCAGFEHHHARHAEEEKDAPPINFFHSENMFYI